MARMKDIEGVKTGNLFTVRLDLLQEEPGFNERDYEAPEVREKIREFADAFMAGRPVPPIQVRLSGETIYLVEGHLRTRGARLAQSEGVDITALQATLFTGDDTDRIAYMVNSSQGLPLSAIGRARAYLKLFRLCGDDVNAVAAKVGRTAQHVNDMLVLANANTDVKGLVTAGTVSATLAISTVREHGDKAGAVLTDAADRAAEQGKSRVTALTVVGARKLSAKQVRSYATEMCDVVAKLLGPVVAFSPSQIESAQITVSGADLLRLVAIRSAMLEGAAPTTEVQADAGE